MTKSSPKLDILEISGEDIQGVKKGIRIDLKTTILSEKEGLYLKFKRKPVYLLCTVFFKSILI